MDFMDFMDTMDFMDFMKGSGPHFVCPPGDPGGLNGFDNPGAAP